MRFTTLAAMGALLGLIQGCVESEPIAAAKEAIVYGSDDRLEAYEHPSDTMREIAMTRVAIKVQSNILDQSNPNDIGLLFGGTLQQSQRLCAGERFASQPNPGECSGTLIDSQLLLTAGHCVSSPSDCSSYSWVFGFGYESAGNLATVTSEDVYGCNRIVAYQEFDGVDYAVVELDRPATGRTPAPVRREDTPLPLGFETSLVGFPNGLPVKIDTGGRVTYASFEGDLRFFFATNDAFSGNSGSGVFDSTGTVVGILTGGGTDYVRGGAGCRVVNTVPESDDDGEFNVYVARALDGLCDSGYETSLCDGVAPPPPSDNLGEDCNAPHNIPFASGNHPFDARPYRSFSQGSCGGLGPDKVFSFTADREANVTIATGGYDTVLYVTTSCGGAEIACNDDVARGDVSSSVSFGTTASQTYFIYVDAYDNNVGNATVAITVSGGDDPPPPPPPSMDAGLPDGGGFDSGLPDSGLPDSGTLMLDDDGDGDDGCDCHAAGSSRNPGAALGFVGLIGLALLRRRR